MKTIYKTVLGLWDEDIHGDVDKAFHKLTDESLCEWEKRRKVRGGDICAYWGDQRGKGGSYVYY